MSANVFILAFVQKMIELLKEFVINVEVKTGETSGESLELINQIMEKLDTKIVVDPNSVSDITPLLRQIQVSLQQWQKDITENKRALAENVMKMLGDLQKTAQQHQLPQGGSACSSGTKKKCRGRALKGGFIRDGSMVTDSMKGGFIRDGSMVHDSKVKR
jgi:hypothetical protein